MYLKKKKKEAVMVRVERAKNHQRLELLARLESDQQKNERLRREKEEKMRNRDYIRYQIEVDKDKVLNDFGELKEGKIAPEVIQEKYYNSMDADSKGNSDEKSEGQKKKRKIYKPNSRLCNQIIYS